MKKILAILSVLGMLIPFSNALAIVQISDGSVKSLWHFDTTPGPLVDSSGNANTLIKYGAPVASSTALLGQAYTFTKTAAPNRQFFQTSSTVGISTTTDLSIHAWFAPTTLFNHETVVEIGGGTSYIIGQGGASIQADGNKFLFSQGAEWKDTGCTFTATSTWTMLDAIYRSSVWYFYKDGSVCSGTTATNIPGSFGFNSTSVGGTCSDGVGQCDANSDGNGSVDEVAIIQSALATTTITALWSGGTGDTISTTASSSNSNAVTQNTSMMWFIEQ